MWRCLASQPTGMNMLQSHMANPQLGVPLVDENNWDPTRIFHQWNMAFPVDTQSIPSNSPQMPYSAHGQGMTGDGMPVQYSIQYTPPGGKMMSMDMQAMPQPATYEPQPVQPVMTARDWQQSVASVYDPHGIKRRYNNSVDMSGYNPKRSR